MESVEVGYLSNFEILFILVSGMLIIIICAADDVACLCHSLAAEDSDMCTALNVFADSSVNKVVKMCDCN